MNKLFLSVSLMITATVTSFSFSVRDCEKELKECNDKCSQIVQDWKNPYATVECAENCKKEKERCGLLRHYEQR